MGNTIAVLGSGINNIYPKENLKLANDIIENGGCIISEYPNDAEVKMSNFPKRNRIISAISEGILVIEAKYRSGSTITANLGFKQGKKVFCLPSNIDSKLGVGTNKLIQKGAKLVINVEDIFSELGIKKLREDIVQKWKYEEKNVPKEYKEIYKAIGNSPTDINTICYKTNIPIQEVSQKLTMLEIKEYIRVLPGDMFVKV